MITQPRFGADQRDYESIRSFHFLFHFIFYFLSTVAPSICIDCFTGGCAKIHIIYNLQ